MKKLFSLLLGACTVLAACTDDVENIRQDGSAQLAVNVKVNPTSRAMVYGTALPGGSSIGINVTDVTGNPYDGKDAGYLNVQYTATGEAGTQTWAPATDAVLLSGTEGKMYAYYPWTTGIDYTAVAVDVADQIDWMYAADAYTVSDAKNAHEIVLSHAQTAINVNLVRDASYTGVGAVEALTVTSEGLASTASLDTRDGSFASVTGVNTAISIIEAPYTLDGSTLSSQENPYMFIPASAETKDFTVSATLDGKSYSHKITMAEAFAPGKVYKINVTFKNTGLEVSTVTLVDWVETGLGDAEFKPEQSETQEPYADWVKLIYNVTDNSTATQIFSSSDFDIANVSEMAVLENGTSQTVNEPVTVIPDYTYSFTTTGEHEVYVKFVDQTAIPNSVFKLCKNLTSITIPRSVKKIEESAFWYSTGLKDVNFGEGVEVIEDGAFVFCEGLTEIIIGPNVHTIEEKAFQGCQNLSKVTMGDAVQTIGVEAFYYCKGLSQVTIGPSVKTICERAFQDCEGLTSITIGEKVETIGFGAFTECDKLTEMIVDGNNTVFDSRGGCNGIMETATKTLVVGCKNTVIPQDCEIIGMGAFSGCWAMTSIVIPESVTNIGDGAFYHCEELMEVVIPNSVETIGIYAFGECYELGKVTLGNKVTTIGEGAFTACENLGKIISLATNAPNIGDGAFFNIRDHGLLVMPDDGIGYDDFLNKLPENWGLQTMTVYNSPK